MASERRRDERADRQAEGRGRAGQRKAPPLVLAGAEDRSPGSAPVVKAWPIRHAPRRSLPSPLTDFVGREREIVALAGLLRETRLVTMTGAGGIGKTRLAQRVAGEVAGEFTDGVYWVDLAALADPELICSAVAGALGVHEDPARPLGESLADWLGPRNLLLLLDNCEHLIGGCASPIETLLRAAPDLRVLATSRQVIGLIGETNWPVPPLSLPEAGPRTSDRGRTTPNGEVERLLRSEAGQLFVRRARAVRPSFELTEQNAASIAEICRRLEGIPLALELAAARLNALSAEQVLARLDDRFGLLTGGARTVLPRHRTLTALVDWSHDLLGQDERILFRRLSVFAGGWTLEAAEAVCGGVASGEWRVASEDERYSSPDVLDLLGRLVDKSLVMIDELGGEVRYRFLETLRQYAAAKLRAAGEEATLRHRHAEWLLALAELAGGEMDGPSQAASFDRIEREHDNARAVLGNLDEGERADQALRLGRALWRFWLARGYLAEGSTRLAAILALPGASGRTALRAEVLFGAGRIAYVQGAYATARSRFEESLAIARAVRYRAYVAASLTQLGHIARGETRHAVARGLYEEALAIRQELGHRREIAINLQGLGTLAHARGELVEARSRYEDSLANARQAGDRSEIALVLFRLGELAVDEGKVCEAQARYAESLTVSREIGNRSRLAYALEGFARLASAQGRPEDAIRLSSAAAALRHAIGAQALPADRAKLECALTTARGRLGETVSAELWAAGQAMSLDEALEFALAAGTGPVSVTAPEGRLRGSETELLTGREREVAALIAGGLSNQQLAERLMISERTAANHVHSILGKLELHSRVQVAAWAFEVGLTPRK